MQPEILRPLSTGELLDKTFSLYRSHFAMFAAIMAIPMLVFVSLDLIINAVAPLGGLGSLMVLPVYFTVYLFALGAVVYAVDDLLKDVPASARGSYRRLRGRRWQLVNVSTWYGLMVTLGFFLFFFPAVMMAVRYALCFPVALLEDYRGSQALKRSRKLIKGSIDRVYIVTALGILVSWVGAMIFQWPLQYAQLWFYPVGQAPLWLKLLTGAGTFLAGTLTGAIPMISLVLLYFDFRVRVEGYDLQLMMEMLDRKAAAATVATAAAAGAGGSSPMVVSP